MSRSIHMGYSYSAYFIITQLKQDQEHFEGLYADLPANRKFEVLPGEEFQSNCMVYQPERHTTYTNIIQRTI